MSAVTAIATPRSRARSTSTQGSRDHHMRKNRELDAEFRDECDLSNLGVLTELRRVRRISYYESRLFSKERTAKGQRFCAFLTASELISLLSIPSLTSILY